LLLQFAKDCINLVSALACFELACNGGCKRATVATLRIFYPAFGDLEIASAVAVLLAQHL